MKINAYHYFKRNFAQNSDFVLKQKFFKKNRLGALPYEWIQNINRQNINEITEHIDNTFKKYAVRIAGLTKDTIETENINLRNNLSSILNRNDIEIPFYKSGFYKNCQKLRIGKYDYALLTFRDGVDNSEAVVYGHGAQIEPCLIFHMYKNYSRGRVAKPFMTRFASNKEDRDAYMLVKFINPNDSQRTKVDAPLCGKSQKYRVDSIGTGNVVNGVIVDVGGMKQGNEILPKDLQDLLIKAENYIRQIFHLKGKHFAGVKDNKEQLEIARASINADKIICNLLNNDIDIYNGDNREILKTLNKYEQRFFLKKVRALRKYHKLKIQLQENGNYNEYKEYINQRHKRAPNGAKSILLEINK